MASSIRDSAIVFSDENAVSHLLEKKAETLDQLRTNFLLNPSETTGNFNGSYLNYIRARYASGSSKNTNTNEVASLKFDNYVAFEVTKCIFVLKLMRRMLLLCRIG
jgi:hypothetical protein